MLVCCGVMSMVPSCPTRAALTVSAARLMAASDSSDAWAYPVASPDTLRRPNP